MQVAVVVGGVGDEQPDRPVEEAVAVCLDEPLVVGGQGRIEGALGLRPVHRGWWIGGRDGGS